MAADLIAGVTVFAGRIGRELLQNVGLTRHFMRIGNDLQRNFYRGSIWIIWWINRFSCENMNGQNRQRQRRIAENSVLAVASVEQSEEHVFEMDCKMRAAGNCGQAGSAWWRRIVKGGQAVPPEQLQDACLLFRLHKAGRSCSPCLEKRSLFSPPPPHARSMAWGFRCLRAAIRATRPEPRQHF